ncbi:MAG TPA: tetratricopeptide repeat protein [Fimbriimonas sp.]|nr:tetratricopeptide repeat protein [Fimbriimonas sp.]
MEDRGASGRLQEITDLLAQAKSEEALEVAESELQSYPDDARLTMLHGIALSGVGRIDEGTAALRKATALAPTDPETFHNLAVQLLDQGDKIEAAHAARQAIKLDPNHAGALETLRKCECEPGEADFKAVGKTIEPPIGSIRTGPDDPVPHLIGLGKAWTNGGYVLLGLCFLQALLLLIHSPYTTTGLRADNLSIFVVFAWITTGLLVMSWMIFDVIDRKMRFVWLLPIFICGLTGLVGLPLAFYMFVGRRVR